MKCTSIRFFYFSELNHLNLIFFFITIQVGSIFKRQQELEEKGSLYQFDPNCTIFVLNKWDQVPDDEDEEVLQTITETLQKYWPTSRNTDIAEQMFRLSTIEVCSIKLQCNNTMLNININTNYSSFLAHLS